MKTILVVFITTLVFIVSMVFIESKRQEELNRINLEYQQGLYAINALDSMTIDTIDTNLIDSDEKEEEITIKISGAVSKEGEYKIEPGTLLDEILNKAILKSNYDSDCINKDYILTKSMSIYIPFSNNNNKISINTADSSTLDLLPGIGATLANRIIEYRESNGDFEILEDIKNVEGIGDSAFNKIEDYIKL